jgi:hypothetical protein
MSPLWAHLPGIQASASRCATAHYAAALDFCAPFCSIKDSWRAASPRITFSTVSSFYRGEDQIEVDNHHRS